MSKFKGKEKPSWIRTREFSIDLIERDRIQRRLSIQKAENGPINIHRRFNEPWNIELEKGGIANYSSGCVVGHRCLPPHSIIGKNPKDYCKRVDEYWKAEALQRKVIKSKLIKTGYGKFLKKREEKILRANFSDDRC